MRILILTIITFCFTGIFAQKISSGTAVFKLNLKSVDSYYSSGHSERITVKFNDRYLWYTSENDSAGIDEYRATWTLEDKTTGKATNSFVNREDKYVQFYYDDSNESEEEDSGQEFEKPYYVDDETDLDNYHEDFYKDLMKIKPRVEDTILETTDETRTILGYTCKKSILKINGKETIVAWSTTEITGLENMFKLTRFIKGTILSYYSKNSYFEMQIDAVELNQNFDLVEKDLYSLPNGYTLLLSTIYYNMYEQEEDINPVSQMEIPLFVKFPYAKETVEKIISEIEKSIHFKEKDDEYVNVRVAITYDEKGAISLVEFTDDTESLAAKNSFDKKLLTNELKKNCGLNQPITLYDKAIPVTMKIDYSYYK